MARVKLEDMELEQDLTPRSPPRGVETEVLALGTLTPKNFDCRA